MPPPGQTLAREIRLKPAKTFLKESGLRGVHVQKWTHVPPPGQTLDREISLKPILGRYLAERLYVQKWTERGWGRDRSWQTMGIWKFWT